MAKGAIGIGWDYLRDLMSRKKWNPNAEPDLETEEDISGKLIIVTGCTAGIGKEVVLQLAKRGAKVIMACRDLEKAEKVKAEILTKVSEANLEIMLLDLADLKSIREFVQQFQQKYDKLDILVNNAGVLSTDGVLKKTNDGFEYHIGTNHLGPFYLTRLLLNSLKKGAPSKIVCVSSTQILASTLDLEDLMMEKGVKTGDLGKEPYNISKMANALCMRRLAHTLGKDSNIRVFNLCPGLVNTDIGKSDNGFFHTYMKTSMKVVGISAPEASETVIFCTTSKKLSEEPESGIGEIYRFSKYWTAGNTILVNPEDPQTIKLYEMSEKLVGL